jgi:hypothetical protein
LVGEVKKLKAVLRNSTPGPSNAGTAETPEAAAARQLTAITRILCTCVSLVHERRHELLLRELLDLPLWQVPQVGAAQKWVLRKSRRCVRCHRLAHATGCNVAACKAQAHSTCDAADRPPLGKACHTPY